MTHSLATEMGTLYIVATPIGNREDITLRALTVLKSVDLILAEDTRHSLQLLSFFGINNKVESFHAHNEHDKSKAIIDQLMMGKSIALISDAGTPLINDPGFTLVDLARKSHIPVTPIPGACALISALCASGVPCDSFLFLGFLPAKTQARKNKLISLRAQQHTLIFYESTHRILSSIEDIALVFGEESKLVLVKELTKTFESFIHGTILDIRHWLLDDCSHQKGEFVLIIPPRPSMHSDDTPTNLLKILLEELPLKQAVAIAGKLTDTNKNQLYEIALSLKSNKANQP